MIGRLCLRMGMVALLSFGEVFLFFFFPLLFIGVRIVTWSLYIMSPQGQ
jgi:hypothetical protein